MDARIRQLKGRASLFAPYFQAYSGTAGTAQELRRLYGEALALPGAVMLIVGTRPDCLSDEALDLLSELSGKLELWLELGLQSANDQTLRRINRGHDFACFKRAVDAAHQRGIKTAAHVIIGLPGEGKREILYTAQRLGELPLDGVKLHSLHVVRGSVFAEEYAAGEIKLLSRETYVGWACDFLEQLPERMVIGRLTGEAPRETLVAPDWCLDKQSVLRAIEKELIQRNSRQGSAAFSG